ncbi:sugar transferase [Vaginisenegalia massiliensis]|uniref:sugar transferase n=1 Tax=Vaginisenegalia massiliensis TaxID=2058294 RepID=UPI000F529E6B|nr:sugar transferase [Vaginisenegalia massiliensis]
MKRQKDVQQLLIMLYELFGVLFSAILVMNIPHSELNKVSVLVIGLIHIVIFYVIDYYSHYTHRGIIEELRLTIFYSIVMMLGMSFVSFISKDYFMISRRGMMFFLVINFVVLLVLNRLMQRWWSSYAADSDASKKVYLLTVANRLEKIRQLEEGSGYWGGKIVGVTLLDQAKTDMQAMVAQFPSFTFIPCENMWDFATHSVVDEIFVNLPAEGEFDLKHYVADFERLGADVSVNINAFDFPSEGDKKVQQLAGHTVVTFSTKFYDYDQIILKRLMDIVGAIFGLILCGLVTLVIGPMIYSADKGPVFFCQNRIGKNGRVFKFYKFRSMYRDAEERKQELLAQNKMEGLMFKVENDPRITPIGHFIRRTSLDELPQFWNVLKGDMSLVGTRPPTEDEYNHYTPEQKRRLSFKPGITGLWQVSGRSDLTDFEEIVRLDVSYIDNWSIWQDIKILLKTIKVVALREGAE